jgi:hypothetical protein
MVRTQAHRQHLAALGGSPTGRKPPLVRTESPSPSGRKARKPQVDSQVLANEDVVVNAESENSVLVQDTANNDKEVSQWLCVTIDKEVCFCFHVRPAFCCQSIFPSVLQKIGDP